MTDEHASTPPPAGLRARCRALALRVYDRFESLLDSRLTVMLLFVTLGVVLVIVAAHLGVGVVHFDGLLTNGFKVFEGQGLYKEVGYFYALNWSVFGCLLAPFVVYAGMGVLQSIRTTLFDLCERGMIRDNAFRRVPLSEIEPYFQAYLRRSRALFLLIFALVMIFMLSDWWDVVGKPILFPQDVHAPITDPALEYDWSVASLYAHQTVSKWGLFVFGLVGYVALAGFIPAFAFGSVLSGVYFVTFLVSIDKSRTPYRLAAMPDKGFNDPFFGFKNFEFFFNSLLMACIVIMLSLWLMLLQNVYLRDVGARNIFEFILSDLGFAKQVLGLEATLPQIGEWIARPALHTVSNIQVILSVLLTPTAFLLALGLCWMLLRKTALNARSFSRQHLAEIGGELNEAPETILPHLRDMKIWPVGWISSVQLGAVMLVLAASMVSYRLIFVPLTFMALKLFSHLVEPVGKWAIGLIADRKSRSDDF